MGPRLDYSFYELDAWSIRGPIKLSCTKLKWTLYLNSFKRRTHSVCVPILFGLISILGVVGNSLVVYVILSKSRMRTVTNFLLLNLALADLAFVVVIPPFTAYQFATAGWPFGLHLCRLMHYLVNVTAYVTVYTIVLVSLVRYLTVVRGPETVWLRTPRNIALILLGLWTIMLLLNIPILSSYELKYEQSPSLTSPSYQHWPDCDIVSMDRGRAIYSTFFTFAYLLPLATVALLYVGIIRHVAWARGRCISQLPGKTSREQTSEGKSHRHGNILRRRRQLGRLLIFVVSLFAALWLPIHIHLIIAYFGDIPDSRAYEAISVLFNALAYTNSCVNPIIYNCTSKEFRDAFRRLRPHSSRREVADADLILHVNIEVTRNTMKPGQLLDDVNRSGCCISKKRRRDARRAQLTFSTTYDKLNVPIALEVHAGEQSMRMLKIPQDSINRTSHTAECLETPGPRSETLETVLP